MNSSAKVLEPTNRSFWYFSQTPLRAENNKLVDPGNKPLEIHFNTSPNGQVTLNFSHLAHQLKHSKYPGWDHLKDNQFNRLLKDIMLHPSQTYFFNNFEILVTPHQAAHEARQALIYSPAYHPELHRGLLNFDKDSEIFHLNRLGEPDSDSQGNFQKALFVELVHRQPDGTRLVLAQLRGSDRSNISTPTLIPLDHTITPLYGSASDEPEFIITDKILIPLPDLS